MAPPHTMQFADRAGRALMIAIHDALLARLRTSLASHLVHEEAEALPRPPGTWSPPRTG
jgi:hypothetical protein